MRRWYVQKFGYRQRRDARPAIRTPKELWLIVGIRPVPAIREERPMSHQPPKTSKKKPQHTPKEKKSIKQQKKHAGESPSFIKH